MSDTKTLQITLHITKESHDMLMALTDARNGNVHNVASSVIREGVLSELDDAPKPLVKRYNQHLAYWKEFG